MPQVFEQSLFLFVLASEKKREKKRKAMVVDSEKKPRCSFVRRKSSLERQEERLLKFSQTHFPWENESCVVAAPRKEKLSRLELGGWRSRREGPSVLFQGKKVMGRP